MNEFEIFMSKNGGAITKASLESFRDQNRAKITGPVEAAINALDKALSISIAPGPDGTRSIPAARGDRNARLVARNGAQVLDNTFLKVEGFVTVLQALERVFNPNITGAFEVSAERAPSEDMRYSFATTKFVKDHVAPFICKNNSQLVAAAQAVAKRRMVTDGPPAIVGGPPVPAFTNITTSSTMALNSEKLRKGLDDEITGRQREFEAIYNHLTSQDNRLAVLMQGEHEEIVFTTLGKYKFFEANRPAAPNADPLVTPYADNYLRYSVQKVGDSWRLHHMAGRVAPTEAAVAPNAAYHAFDYTKVPGITPVPGTFSKIA